MVFDVEERCPKRYIYFYPFIWILQILVVYSFRSGGKLHMWYYVGNLLIIHAFNGLQCDVV